MNSDEGILLARVHGAITDFRPLSAYAQAQVVKIGSELRFTDARDIAAVAKLQGAADAWSVIAKLEEKCLRNTAESR